MSLLHKLHIDIHPAYKNTFCWALILQPSSTEWIINEIQSDKADNLSRAKYRLGDKNGEWYASKLKEYDLYSWPYMLMNTVLKAANNAGIEKLFMATASIIGKRWSPYAPKSALHDLYTVLPRKYGFKIRNVGGRKLWLLEPDKFNKVLKG